LTGEGLDDAALEPGA